MTAKNPAARIVRREHIFRRFHAFELVQAEPRSLRHDGYAPLIEREVLRSRAAVIVLVYAAPRDAIVLTEQFRMGPFLSGADNPFLMECPAGYIDEGETPEDAARREVLEETGCAVRDMEFIGFYHPSPGTTDERFHIYAARTDDAQAGIFGVEEEAEEIRTHVLPAARVIDMLDRGEITNAASALALQWFARHRDRLREKWGAA